MECQYDSYRKQVQQLNISFTKLGEEECEDCTFYNLHKHTDPEECGICEEWKLHNEKAKESRAEYKKNVETSMEVSDTKYVSVDMQKVVLLPRMTGLKTCIFTRRLVVFHLTFAPLGKSTERPTVLYGMKV